MKILLVGFMGSGKTTVGRRLAGCLGWPFLDTDDLIGYLTGQTAAAYLSQEGEEAFRRVESEALQLAADLDRAVIATGGGAWQFPANRRLFENRNTRSVWLQAAPGTIIERVGRGVNRPLLGTDPGRAIERLLPEREASYALTDLHLKTDGRSPEDLVELLLTTFDQRPQALTGPNAEEDGPRPVFQVRTGPAAYPYLAGPGLLERLPAVLATLGEEPLSGRRQIFLVAPPLLQALYGSSARERLEAAGWRVSCLIVPDGESSKDLANLQGLYARLAEARARRDSFVVALGGGVTGDLAGFAAATYLRGLPLIQAPTTLLAQVDASLGGKTAINHPAGKNLIGSFYQPRAVVADTSTLLSLPEAEWRAGLGEVLKHALLAGGSLLAWLESRSDEVARREPALLGEIVARAARVKAEIVAEDPLEQNVRMYLNLGHTFAHALEKTAGYGHWRHGEAVAVGIRLATELSVRLGLAEPSFLERVRRLLTALRLPAELRADAVEAVLAAMEWDKKAAAAGLRFVLPLGPGQVTIRSDVPLSEVRAVLAGEGEA